MNVSLVGAVALATAETPTADGETPIVTYQPYGAGRVVVIEGAGMWRWAFLAPQYRAHDAVYSSLWQSLLRWLVSRTGLLPGQTILLRADKVTFSVTESASATLLVREETVAGEAPSIELTSAVLSTPRVIGPTPVGDEPGTYRVVFGVLPEGRYRARVVGAAADDVSQQSSFDVRSFLEERLDLKARPELMARLAEEGGGTVLGKGAAGQIAKHFRQQLARNRPPRVRHLTAWDRWWWLLAVFVMWTSAWALRRSGGLI